MPILLYYDPIFLKHDTGKHPENAARLLPSLPILDSFVSRKHANRPTWMPAPLSRVHYVHGPKYVEEIRAFARIHGAGHIEQDTVISEHSFDVALMAAGAVCDAVDRITRGEDTTAFCLVRPPGHHAMPDHAMGFCLFNNIAIGAKTAIAELGYERALIVDWDVHHGNGTQAMFWTDPDVAFFSMHRAPFYPLTGDQDEIGAGEGLGTTRNLPIAFGTPPDAQLRLFESELTDFADSFRPQLVFISAGFDAHRDDPIGSLGLDSKDFGTLTKIVVQIAAKHAGGKIISVLEGGYNPKALAESVEQHLNVLAGD